MREPNRGNELSWNKEMDYYINQASKPINTMENEFNCQNNCQDNGNYVCVNAVLAPVLTPTHSLVSMSVSLCHFSLSAVSSDWRAPEPSNEAPREGSECGLSSACTDCRPSDGFACPSPACAMMVAACPASPCVCACFVCERMCEKKMMMSRKAKNRKSERDR